MSEERLRAFLAVDPPGEVRAEAGRVLAELQRLLPTGVRWTPREQLHITLRFLGDVPSESIPELASRAAARLAPLEAFEAVLGGVGAFPNARAARVLWLGVAEGAGPLARLARRLESAARAVGAQRERRPFRPHLTLGRLREPRPVALERLRGPGAIGFPVEEVVLYESRLSSSGATHIPLARLPLAADDAGALDLAPEP